MVKEKIIVYGAGLEGEKFYCLYHDKYEIVYFIDRNANRVFHGIDVYSFEEKEEELVEKKYKVVIAAKPHFYYEIAELLESKGLREFNDFIEYGDINKELIVLYGNCHMGPLEKYLKSNAEFERKYTIKRIHVVSTDAENLVLKYASVCKVFIAQDIRRTKIKQFNGDETNVPGVRYIFGKLPKECKKVIIPNLYGMNLFFPQAVNDDWDKILKIHMGEGKLVSITEAGKTEMRQIVGYRDKYIEEKLGEESIDDIVKFIEDPNSIDKEKIIDVFKKNILKLKEREKQCDIIISDFILKCYREIPLFYDPGHPTNELIYEKGRRILKELNIEEDDNEKVAIPLDATEMFIYGSVIEALGLKYKRKYIKNSLITCHKCPITLREFIKEYSVWSNDI